jgi:hypothetical protein
MTENLSSSNDDEEDYDEKDYTKSFEAIDRPKFNIDILS